MQKYLMLHQTDTHRSCLELLAVKYMCNVSLLRCTGAQPVRKRLLTESGQKRSPQSVLLAC